MRRNKVLFIIFVSLAAAAYGAEKKKKLSLHDLLKSSGKSTSNRSATVAGVRGLDETGAGVDTKARDFVAVDKMDQWVVTPEQINAFILEGKLK